MFPEVSKTVISVNWISSPNSYDTLDKSRQLKHHLT